MNITKALAHEGPALLCRQNGATITIATGPDGEKTYAPDKPAGTPTLARETFAQLYRDKLFDAVEPEKSGKAKPSTTAPKEG